MTRPPLLNRALLREPEFQRRADVAVPSPALLDLPERAIQFGTGVFVRGFVDYFIDEANRRGRFGGRVVAVSSTGSGRAAALRAQDGLYTLCTRGTEAGREVQRQRIVSSLSRTLSAKDEWDAVLECARDPALELVFSNTTEVGIALDAGDDPSRSPPRSFPGKLTRFLFERAEALDYDPARGLVVLPCELIEDNGDRLREIVLTLAERWGLGERFERWIRAAVPFCNTLVDRIVSGTPDESARARLAQELGYRDELLTVCEVYRLFAIEAEGALRERLAPLAADAGVVFTESVRAYRERKVRLLNAAHTAIVSAALLCGCETVRDAVEHPLVGVLLRRTMLDEIVPVVEAPHAAAFAREVLQRFANPFIEHALFDITLQGTTKMCVRVAPLIVRHARRRGAIPAALTFGFAAFLLFMRGELRARRRAAGLPVPRDAAAERLRGRDAREICRDESLWGPELAALPGFADAVAEDLARMESDGVEAALARLLSLSDPAARSRSGSAQHSNA
ncbi:MAG TPA: tagaturonate reductase [Longimicrobiaceae bacterium]|nr:tagaturonate reductase [Longimicrobiaceae bacterium]